MLVKRQSVGAVLGALALILGACAQGGDGADGGSDSTAGDDTETTSDSDSEPETEEEVDGEEASGGPIKLGWISDLTGPASIAGIGNRDGALLAVDMINEEGGVLGRELTMDVADEGCSPDTAIAATQRFIDDEELFMLVGGSCSGDVLAMKDVVTDAEVPFFVAQASSVDIVAEASDYVYTHMILTDDEAEFLTRTAVEKFQPERLGVIYTANEYGQSGARNIVETAENLGIDVAEPIEVPLETTDFSPYIQQLKESSPDVVIPVLYEVPAFTRQAKQNGLESNLVYFGSLPLRSAMLPLAESGDLEGLSTSFTTPYQISSDSESPEMAAFVEAFHERYDKFPDVPDLMGYQAIHVVATVLEEAGTVDREAWLDTLVSMGPIDLGLTFPLEFGPADNRGLEEAALITFGTNDIPGPNSLYPDAEIVVAE